MQISENPKHCKTNPLSRKRSTKRPVRTHRAPNPPRQRRCSLHASADGVFSCFSPGQILFFYVSPRPLIDFFFFFQAFVQTTNHLKPKRCATQKLQGDVVDQLHDHHLRHDMFGSPIMAVGLESLASYYQLKFMDDSWHPNHAIIMPYNTSKTPFVSKPFCIVSCCCESPGCLADTCASKQTNLALAVHEHSILKAQAVPLAGCEATNSDPIVWNAGLRLTMFGRVFPESLLLPVQLTAAPTPYNSTSHGPTEWLVPRPTKLSTHGTRTAGPRLLPWHKAPTSKQFFSLDWRKLRPQLKSLRFL